MQPGGNTSSNGMDPFANAGTLESAPSPGVPVMQAATPTIVNEPPVDIKPPRGPKTLLHFNKAAFVVTAVAVVVVFAAGLITLGMSGFKPNDQKSVASKQAANNYDVKDLSAVKSTSDQLDKVTEAAKLSINGELQVGNTFILTPTATPSKPQVGQIYYNRDNNTAYVYNGSTFVSLSDQPDVKSLGGVVGDISLGTGLQLSGNQLSLSSAVQQSIAAKVTTLQGQVGDVVLTAGNGINVNGTTISNTGVVRVQGLNGISVVQNNGDVTLGLPQALSPTSTPTFAGAQFSSALGITSGGTNANGASYANRGVFYFNGTSFVTTATPSSNGLCLLSGASGPYFGSCSESEAAGVASITGSGTGSVSLTGSIIFSDAVTVDNGTAKLVTIQAAGVGTSGLVTADAQSFSGVKTFTDNVVAEGTVTADAFIGNGSGVSNVNAERLDGQYASYYLNATNINDGFLSDSRLSSNVALKDAATNTFTGNIVAVAVSATTFTGNGAGLTDVDAARLGGEVPSYYRDASSINAGTLADTYLSNNVPLINATLNDFAGTLQAVTLKGDGSEVTNVNAASLGGQSASYYRNASNINAGTLADTYLSANVARYNATIADFTGTLQQNGDDVCTKNNNNCNFLTGSSANGVYVQLQANDGGTPQTGNLNITGVGRAGTLYQSGYQVCDMSGNCNGIGGVISGSGTPNTIPLFTGEGKSLGDSLLSQSGLTTVAVGGTLTAINLSGNGQNVTNVNAARLAGNDASFYASATNLTAGTLSDSRLSVNVARYNASIANFTGTLQQGGDDVCTKTANNCEFLTGSGAEGSYIQLQATTSGTPQTGNLKITGAAIAGSFTGNGANLTNVDAVTLGDEVPSYYRNASNINAGTLADAYLSANVARYNATIANFTGTLQQGGDDVCTKNNNNCNILTGAGADGAYVQIQATIPGTPQIGNLNISGAAIAGTFSGDGSQLTNVNAISLDGQPASFYRSASNINAGTLADGRLSTNVARYNATIANFTGTLQQGGDDVCTKNNNNCNFLTGSSADGVYVQLQVADGSPAQTGHFNISGVGRANELYQGGNKVCDESGNCNGIAGVVTGSGTGGAIPVFGFDGQSITDSILTQSGTVVTAAGTVAATNLSGNGTNVTNVNAVMLGGEAASFYRSASNINAGTLADTYLSANVARYGATVANFAGTLQQNGDDVCLKTSNNCNILTGAGADGAYIQLQGADNGTAQTGHFNISGVGRANEFYQNGYEVCDASGNCVGAGGEITGEGTPGNIAIFTNEGKSLGDSILTQTSSSTLSVTGTLSATNLAGNGTNVTNVNAALFGSNNAAFYLNASNINAGELDDAHLSSNVALYDAALNNFTGNLQQAGNTVCTVANNCSYLTQITANDIYIQLQASDGGTSQTGNMNITGVARAATLYQNGNQVCDTSGNCNGVTGAVTGTGTPGAIALFTSSGVNGTSLGNSILTQASTTVTVAGTLSATNLAGNGTNVTNVNAISLSGQTGTFYRSASNINAGELADTYLSDNVALLDADNTFSGANTFTGILTASSIQSAGVPLSITGGTSLLLQSTGTHDASFDSGTTGNVNIGTGENQKTVTVGNSTSASILNLLAGTGGVRIGNAGVANTIQIGNTTGAVAQTINIGNNATASSSTALTIGSMIGASATTINAGTNGVTVRGANSASAFSVQDASSATLFAVNTTSSVVGIGGVPSGLGSKLQVTGAISATGDLTSGGRIYAGQSGVNVISSGTTSESVLYGNGSRIILQNVTLATNNTVKVGTSMGVLYVDGSGNLQVLSVSGQSGNCVNYNGTTVTWSGCSGSGGGNTGWSNGANGYTSNPGTATSRYSASYDATITNPVLGLQGANALDIVTNNQSRIRIGETGDVAVLSNGTESTTRFTVRTNNDGNVEQYINTLVVATTGTGNDYGGRVGIGLKVNTAPQVTLDIGGGRNDFGGSGLQMRASNTPGLSTAGVQGEGTASTGRIYYDNTLRKFRVSENGGAWTDLVVGGGGNPFMVTGNSMNGTTAILGTNDNSALIIRQNGQNRINMDQGGNISLTAGANYSVLVNGASTQSGVALNVNGRILASEYATGGYVGMTTTNPCNSNQTLNGMRVVAGLVVAGSCANNNSDLAEAYNSSDALVPGELVMATTEAATSVKRATGAENDMLMGIVSTAPGQLIGTAQVPNGYPIALSGRVPTKVNGEGGAIAVGDKITISSVPGVGKKATAAGMIVGTAVESFNGVGTGSIEVFVNLTYYEPADLDMLQAQTGNFGDLNISGTATINNLTVTGLASVHDLKISGHIITSSGQPTTQMQAAAGSGATVTVNGNDTTGTITITTGDVVATGEMAKVIFSELYGEAPHIVLSPSNSNAARASYFKGATSTESFMLNFDEAPAANTTYMFDYFISQ